MDEVAGFSVEPVSDSAVRVKPMTAASVRILTNPEYPVDRVTAHDVMCDLSPSLPEFEKSLVAICPDVPGFWIGNALCRRM